MVPPQGREKLVEQLHEGHPGTSRMKSFARSFVWWPGLDSALEDRVRRCEACQRSRHLPANVPIQPWNWPERPWTRIHADYAGPVLGHMLLIVVDAHSKWLEVRAVKNATSSSTIEQFRSIFAGQGLPELLVTDNGTPFTSAESAEFYAANGIRHVTSAPYHPATNGLAERAVQTVKEYLKKPSSETLQSRLSRFLFRYRITPHTTTGVSPAELLMGRRLRSRMDLVLPNLAQRVATQQEKQAAYRNKHTQVKTFDKDDKVFVRDLPSGKDWLPGVITNLFGSKSCEITLSDGRVVRRHYDHIRSRVESGVPPVIDLPPDWPIVPDSSLSPGAELNVPPGPMLRRSTHSVLPPDRLEQTI